MTLKTCTAQQLIDRLAVFISAHGNLPVYVLDADTGWLMEIGLIFQDEDPIEDQPEHFAITTSYHQSPEGFIE